jgi:hypothetical protein
LEGEAPGLQAARPGVDFVAAAPACGAAKDEVGPLRCAAIFADAPVFGGFRATVIRRDPGIDPAAGRLHQAVVSGKAGSRAAPRSRLAGRLRG